MGIRVNAILVALASGPDPTEAPPTDKLVGRITQTVLRASCGGAGSTDDDYFGPPTAHAALGGAHFSKPEGGLEGVGNLRMQPGVDAVGIELHPHDRQVVL